jgi:hypothetical protein
MLDFQVKGGSLEELISADYLRRPTKGDSYKRTVSYVICDFMDALSFKREITRLPPALIL